MCWLKNAELLIVYMSSDDHSGDLNEKLWFMLNICTRFYPNRKVFLFFYSAYICHFLLKFQANLPLFLSLSTLFLLFLLCFVNLFESNDAKKLMPYHEEIMYKT